MTQNVTKFISKFITILIMLTFFNISHALECSKNTFGFDKLICDDYDLARLNEEYNTAYDATLKRLSPNDQQIFNKSLNFLIPIKDECKNIYKIYTNSSDKINMTVGDESESYDIKPIYYQKGCVATWYNSMIYAIKLYPKYRDTIILPSKKEYTKAYNNILIKGRNYPLIFEIEIPIDDLGDDTRAHKDNYILYFLKNGQSFAKSSYYKYVYRASNAHGIIGVVKILF